MNSVATPPRERAFDVSQAEPTALERPTLADFYDRYGPIAYSLALTCTTDSAESERIVTAAFAAAWQSASRQPHVPFVSHLLTAVRTRAASRVGKRAAVPLDRPNGQPADSVRASAAAALNDLSGPQQDVLAPAYFGGLEVNTIAAELRLPVSHVKANLFAALRQLRSALARSRVYAGPTEGRGAQ